MKYDTLRQVKMTQFQAKKMEELCNLIGKNHSEFMRDTIDNAYATLVEKKAPNDIMSSQELINLIRAFQEQITVNTDLIAKNIDLTKKP